MGAFEATNAQYERFDPAHRSLRGKQRFSMEDNAAVVVVSWRDATDLGQWLSKKEGRTYRLPTEAEWEFLPVPAPSHTSTPAIRCRKHRELSKRTSETAHASPGTNPLER